MHIGGAAEATDGLGVTSTMAPASVVAAENEVRNVPARGNE